MYFEIDGVFNKGYLNNFINLLRFGYIRAQITLNIY